MKTALALLSLFLAFSLTQIAALAAPPEGKGPKDKGNQDGGDTTPQLDHRGLQSGLVQMGTSGGWGEDIANGYCCGGTLGSLVKDSAGNIYILSNYHVLAADIVYGGNGILAILDSDVIHPGLIDLQCNATSSNSKRIAGLAQAALPLVDSATHDTGLYLNANVDAAIAMLAEGVVDESGSILGIGTISASTASAFPGQGVKKSGRTTGLSRSAISGYGATVRVSYEDECAGSSIGTATFVDQVVVENKGSKFLAGGDSGSLMVEDIDVNPRAVGLLFAGSNRVAIANPIQDVLKTFAVTMVGDDSGVLESSGQTSSSSEAEPTGFGQARAAQKRASASLMEKEGVVGHAIGVGRSGSAVIKIYVESLSSYDRASIPASIDGVRVVVEETGKIVAF